MKLILGDGLLGSEIRRQTDWDFISRKKDGFDFNTDLFFIDTTKYDTIINCIAFTETYNYDKHKHMLINYKSVIKLTDFCNVNKLKLVHISTDYVYANTKSQASEADIPIHYNNPYVYSKILADEYIQATLKDYLILRASFKERPFKHDEGWINLVGNFDYVDTIAELMVRLIKYDAKGLYNVGTELKTVYDLAQQTNKNVFPSLKENNMIASNDISMNLNKLNYFLKAKENVK